MTRDGMIATCPLTKEQCHGTCAWYLDAAHSCAFVTLVGKLEGIKTEAGHAAGALINIGHNTDGLV